MDIPQQTCVCIKRILPSVSVFDEVRAQTGYVLTAFSITSVIVLAIVIPFLVQTLRPLYMRSWWSPSTAPSTYTEEEDAETAAGVSERVDVHITFVSWIIVTLGMICTGLASTKVTVMACKHLSLPYFILHGG